MLVDEYSFVATTNDNPERFIVKLYDVSSVDEISNNENFIYVDNDEMIIADMKGNAVIEIYDILGRDIMKVETSQNMIRQNVSGFNAGIYIVRIIDDNGIKAHKVIVE